jgi:hypothetical protein
LIDLTEARPVNRAELNVKTRDGGQLISGLVDRAATLDLVSKDFVKRLSLPTMKSKAKTPTRLIIGQCVTSPRVCEFAFELARHEFKRTPYVLRDLRVANLALVSPWLDDEQVSLRFGAIRVFIMMDGTIMETQTEDRRRECPLLSSAKVQKLMRKTRQSKGRNAEFYVIGVTPALEQPVEFYIKGHNYIPI